MILRLIPVLKLLCEDSGTGEENNKDIKKKNKFIGHS